MTVRLEMRPTRSLVRLGAILAGGLALACFSERATATTATCNGTTVPCVVEIRNFGFEPRELRVPAGATVTWVNQEQQAGLAHTSTSDGAGWDSGLISPGASFSRGFSTAGQFAYHCEPHPTMRATIVVE